MYFKESNNFLTKENINFIEKTILGGNFPYYRLSDSVIGDKTVFLVHALLVRLEHRSHKEHINSTFYLDTLSLVHSFFDKFKINYKEILRLCINYTFNVGPEKCPIHQDHEFPHKQLLIYLNEADPLSKTVILDKKNRILKKIVPKKYKGFCFNNLPHYHFYPTKGERIVLVATFR